MFHTIKSCSRPGNIHNEDAFVTGPSFLAVLDGATGLNKVHLTGAATDAQWLSRRTAELLEALLPDPALELPEALRRAARAVKAELDQMGYRDLQDAYPSASVSIVRIRDGYLEGCVLGDCPVLVARRDGVDLIYDDAVARRDAAVLRWMAETCRQRAIPMAEARKLAEPLLLKNRQEMNREESYWIFEPTGAGIAHIRTFRYPLEEAAAAALLTDGFFAWYDPLRQVDSPRALMDSLGALPLDGLLDQLRAVENGDPDLINFPRFKLSDDATAVYAALSGG